MYFTLPIIMIKLYYKELKGEMIMNILKKILIVGNGYDLWCGMKTSYGDYKEWLENYLYQNSTYITNTIVRIAVDEGISREVFSNDKSALEYGHSLRLADFKNRSIVRLYLNKDNESEWISALYSYSVSFFKCENSEFDSKMTRINNELGYTTGKSELNILFFYFMLFSNISSKYGYTNESWGCLESSLNHFYNDSEFQALKTFSSISSYIIISFKLFKQHFVTYFIERAIAQSSIQNLNKRRPHNLKNMNDYVVVDFNYTNRWELFTDSYLKIHGTIKDNSNIVFGANLNINKKVDTLKLVLDKKYQKMFLKSSEARNDFLNKITEIYTLGFSFSQNDDYFIHGILHANPEIKINIIDFENGYDESEDRFVINQLQGLYRSLSAYEHDKKILELKIYRDEIKIISEQNFDRMLRGKEMIL